MPQMDQGGFFSQFFWFTVLFVPFYFFLLRNVVFAIFSVLKFRRRFLPQFERQLSEFQVVVDLRHRSVDHRIVSVFLSIGGLMDEMIWKSINRVKLWFNLSNNWTKLNFMLETIPVIVRNWDSDTKLVSKEERDDEDHFLDDDEICNLLAVSSSIRFIDWLDWKQLFLNLLVKSYYYSVFPEFLEPVLFYQSFDFWGKIYSGTPVFEGDNLRFGSFSEVVSLKFANVEKLIVDSGTSFVNLVEMVLFFSLKRSIDLYLDLFQNMDLVENRYSVSEVMEHVVLLSTRGFKSNFVR